jgi:putative MFS transporter
MMTPSIAARLNRLPVVRTHKNAVAIVGIGAFFDLFDIFLASILASVLTNEFQLDRFWLPAVLGSSFLGMFFGAVFLGRLADQFGRRRMFLVNLGIYSLFTLLGAFGVNATMLVVTRFFAGIGIGAELPLADTYICELLPSRQRGRALAWTYTIGFCGAPAVGWLARILVPLHPLGWDGWRWIFVIGSLGAAIVWTVRRGLPESPRWLESVGRAHEADAITEVMEAEAIRSGPLPSPDLNEVPRRAHVRFSTLFAPEYRRRTVVLWIFQVFQTVGYYGFGTMIPLVLAAKGFSIVTSLTYTSLAFIGYPFGSALSAWIVDAIDRRWLIVASASLMAVFGLALGASTSAGMIVLLGFLYVVVSTVFSNGFHIFQAELFPTFARATAAGSAYGLSRLSSGLMPFVLVPVMDQWGPVWMFAVISAAMLIVVVDIGVFAPSTTGKALEVVSS